MLRFALLSLILAGTEIAHVENWMVQAFYPALVLILVAASLGVPIPEDVPLIVAGVLLNTNEGIASWHGTLIAALGGIMFGDLVLYMLGHRWGPDVVSHRSVRWLITPERFERVSRKFHKYGAWFCFGGRFFMGIRAAMCLTAGATRFPYWRFFIADFCGALLSVPLFVFLGYWFAGMIPTLMKFLGDAQATVTVIAICVVAASIIIYKLRKQRRAKRLAARREARAERRTPAAEPSGAGGSANRP